MRVGEAHIGFGLVPADFGIWQLCQQPNLLTVQQAASGLIVDIAADQRICERESLRVLDDAVLVADHAQNLVVRAADVCLVAGNRLIAAVQPHIAGLDRPVQTGQLQRLCAGGCFLHHGSQTVPRLLPDIEHRFNICRHFSYLRLLIGCGGSRDLPGWLPGGFGRCQAAIVRRVAFQPSTSSQSVTSRTRMRLSITFCCGSSG